MCNVKVDAVDSLLEVLRMQANRETGWFHIPPLTARYMFGEAIAKSEDVQLSYCTCKCPTLDILTDMARKMLDE